MSKDINCPACGSLKVKRFEKKVFEQLWFGIQFSFDEINYKCNACETEGDFLNESEENFTNSKKKAQSELVQSIINHLNNSNISMARFERVFDLPSRTLTRWKNGDFSSSAMALLSLVYVYPWLVEIAEHRFNLEFTNFSLIKAALEVFEKESEKNLNTNFLETKSSSTVTSINFIGPNADLSAKTFFRAF